MLGHYAPDRARAGWLPGENTKGVTCKFIANCLYVLGAGIVIADNDLYVNPIMNLLIIVVVMLLSIAAGSRLALFNIRIKHPDVYDAYQAERNAKKGT